LGYEERSITTCWEEVSEQAGRIVYVLAIVQGLESEIVRFCSQLEMGDYLEGRLGLAEN
jgi:hypothetical protein